MKILPKTWSQSKAVFPKPDWLFRSHFGLTIVLARLRFNFIILPQRDIVIKCVLPSKAFCLIDSELYQ